MKYAARGSLKIKDAKNRHFGTIAQLCRAISSELRYVSTTGKKLFKQQYLLHMPWSYMVNFDLLTAEICWRVWGTPANFNGFQILATLLHGTVVVGVSQTLRRWTEGSTYIRQGGHHVGHWPTFLFCFTLAFEVLWHSCSLCNRCSIKCQIMMRTMMIDWFHRLLPSTGCHFRTCWPTATRKVWHKCAVFSYLWSPYGIGRPYIFSCCGLFFLLSYGRPM